jgi:hypothetical protein
LGIAFVDDVETMAGRTEISTDPATDTSLVNPVPKGALRHEVQSFFYTIDRNGEADLFKSLVFKLFH